jgi:ribosome-binding factor A
VHDFDRADRVGAEMQRELAELIRTEINDPRLGMVTVQEVRVSRDLSHAKVFYTVLDDDKAKISGEILVHAAAFLRRRLGQIMKLRTLPQLHFTYDRSVEDGRRLSALIDQAVAGSGSDKDG